MYKFTYNIKNYNRISALILCTLAFTSLQARDNVVSSPDGHLKATVSDNEKIQWTITHDGTTILAPSAIGIQTTTCCWGAKTRIQKARQRIPVVGKYIIG